MNNNLEKRYDVFISDGWLISRAVIKRGELGKYIAKIRVDLGFSQTELANLLGVSSAKISLIERRKIPITRNIADNFIKQMGLDESERDEFLRLSIMNNAAIAVEKIHKELLGNNNG